MDLTLHESISALNTRMALVLKQLAIGIAISMLLAAGVAAVPGLTTAIFSGIFGWIVVLSPLALSFFLMFRVQHMSALQIKYAFYAFAVCFGLSLSLLFSVYTSASIAQALLGTTISFGALAGWGYFTKRDISSWGSFLFAGVIGILIMGVINIFIASTALQMVLNVLAIVIFLGLTAWDMQTLREQLYDTDDDSADRIITLGALSLFINYINVFVNLLQLFGNKE